MGSKRASGTGRRRAAAHRLLGRLLPHLRLGGGASGTGDRDRDRRQPAAAAGLPPQPRPAPGDRAGRAAACRRDGTASASSAAACPRELGAAPDRRPADPRQVLVAWGARLDPGAHLGGGRRRGRRRRGSAICSARPLRASTCVWRAWPRPPRSARREDRRAARAFLLVRDLRHRATARPTRAPVSPSGTWAGSTTRRARRR